MANVSRTYFKRRGPTLDRLLFLSLPVTETGCWIWLGPVNDDGYGTVKINRRTCSAHRVSYETFIGPIACGMEIDHLCRVRCCINPLHLHPVTHHENVLRGMAGKYLSERTHCNRGHEFTAENTFIRDNGARACRTCKRISKIKYREKLIALASQLDLVLERASSFQRE